MRATWALIGWLAGAGCIRIPVQEPAWASPPEAQQSRDPRLAALADRIDPGKQPPLRTFMAEDLLADVDVVLAGVDPRAEAERQLRGALLQLRETAAPDEATLELVARAVARAEGVVEQNSAPELVVTLLEAYALMDLRAAERAQMFAGPADAVYLRLRRVSAELLRRYAAHPGVPGVLTILAGAARSREEFARAAEIVQVHVAWLGARATADELYALGAACYQALEPACGAAAAARLRGAGGSARADELQGLAELALRARGPVPADVGGQVLRAGALQGLGRTREASEVLARAVATAPSDALPRIGLARLALLRGDVNAAEKELAAARSLANVDRDYFELRIALLWPRLDEAGARRAEVLRELQALADGYRRFERARAGVLAILLAAVAEEGEVLSGLSAAHAKVAALLREFPEASEVRRLACMTAQVAPTADAAVKLLGGPLSPALASERGLVRARAAALFAVAMRWDRRELLPELAAAMEGVPEAARGELGVAVEAARASMSGAVTPPRVAEFYARLAEQGVPEDRLRAHNNLAVLETSAGRFEQGVQRWTAALGDASADQLLRINMAGALIRHDTTRRPELAELLANLADTADTPELGLLALAWRSFLIANTDGVDDGRARPALLAAWRVLQGASPGAAAPGLWDMLSGPPRVYLHFGDERLRGAQIGGLQFTADVERVYWLLVHPPLDPLVVPMDAKRGKPAKASAGRR